MAIRTIGHEEQSQWSWVAIQLLATYLRLVVSDLNSSLDE